MAKNLFSFIAVFCLGIAIFLFWSTADFLYQKSLILLSLPQNLLQPLIVFSLAIVSILTITSILSLIIEQKFYAVVSLFIINLSAFLFLPFHLVTLILFFIFALALAFTLFLLQREQRQHLRFSASHQFPSHLKHLLFIISLLFSLGFYHFAGPNLQSYQIILPPKLEQKIIDFALQSSPYQPPSASYQLPGPRFLPPNFLQEQLNNFIAPFRPYLPLFFAVSIFLTFNWLSFFFVFLSIFFANIIIAVLKIFCLLKVEKISKEAESFTL